MTVECTLAEAELLIAILTGAEGVFAVVNPALVEALNELRPWRSVLLQSYLRCRLKEPEADPAVAGDLEESKALGRVERLSFFPQAPDKPEQKDAGYCSDCGHSWTWHCRNGCIAPMGLHDNDLCNCLTQDAPLAAHKEP